MSVIFRIDTQLTTLKDALIKDISNHKNDIFQCSYIATTGEGVTAWISENIAKTNGIHAHFKYVSIQEILTQIYRATQPHQKMINNKDFIWLIYDVLFEGHSKNEAINEYFRVQPISCCMMIADLLDKEIFASRLKTNLAEKNRLFSKRSCLCGPVRKDETGSCLVFHQRGPDPRNCRY